MEKIAILGAGSWGSTLACLLASKGHKVSLWEFDRAAAERLKKTRKLMTIPKLSLPGSVTVTDVMEDVLRGADLTVLATPSHFLRDTLTEAAKKGLLSKEMRMVSVTKGIEVETLKRMSEIIEEKLPGSENNVCVLSGPSHAEEVTGKIPTAVVAASKDTGLAEKIQNIFMTDFLRVYTSDDVIGVELGGSLKNIYAIACGISDGLDLGDNTKAALITRGLAEMIRFGTYLGGKPSTFFGLSGIGDLIVTCFSKHSRNRALGEKIGKGKKLEEALKEMTMVAEGVRTTKSVQKLARKLSVEIPITTEIYRCLYEGKKAGDSLTDLMQRPAKPEIDERTLEALGKIKL